jgi:RES domain-containing protein
LSEAPAFDGLVYRVLNPRWANEPLSGEGAALYVGRFNKRGRAVLYTSLSPVTAMREAQIAGSFQPITLVALRVRLTKSFDARDADALAAYAMTPAMLADTGWREAMNTAQPVTTQAFAETLMKDGYQALTVPSYARGAGRDDLNLVILVPDAKRGISITLIDDERRLAQ